MDNKANDWILSTMANPEFTAGLFIDAGINSNNTSIYERDKYLNSLLILNSPEFLTNGKFDRAKFNSFYDNAISKYQELAMETSHPDTAKAMFSYNNVWVDESRRKKGLDDKDFSIKTIFNPDRRKFGVEKIGYVSDKEFTPQEIAQTQKVYDPETGKWEESPNDSWLLRNWFEPVALATWDFDADINGNPTSDPSKVYYQKGLPKINEETGTYYYEKLNGKEPYGKQILTPFDVLTTDGSAANKYDFFDSDSIDKSFVGTLAKNAMRIVPLFIPYVNTAYIALNIADEMAKVLPIVYKSTFGLMSDDNSFANTIEAFAMLFDNNKVSEKGQENFFNSESLLNMVADVALLLYELRWLFTKAPKQFGLKKYDISSKKGQMSELEEVTKAKALEYQKELGDKGLQAMFELGPDEMGAAAFAKSQIWAENYMKEYQNIGRILSRYFMAGTSSFQAFQDAREEGASDWEAAALFWGYFSGMYAIMGTDIGEHILPELRLSKLQIRDALVNLSRGDLTGEVVGGMKAVRNTSEKVGLFKKIFNKGADLAETMHKRHVGATAIDTAKSIGANMLAEGVEEVSEELLYDLTKATFNIISEFSGGTKLSAWDNMLERYGQSFVGGLLGGGVFEAGNSYKILKPKLLGEQYDPNNLKANQTLIYLLRNGEKEEIMNSLNYLRKHKMLGNSSIGANIKGVDNEGNVIYSEGTKEDNLNEAAYRLMVNYINNIETVLNKENMLTSDTGLISGDGIEEADVMLHIRYTYLMGSPTVGKLLQDYNNLANEFLVKYNEILTLEGATDDSKRNNPSWLEDLDKARLELEEIRKKREEFFSKETLEYYTGLMLFAANSNMAKPFARITFKDYAENIYKKKFSELTDNERAKAQEKYELYLQNNANDEILCGYDLFMKMNKQFGAMLMQMGENSKKYVEGRHTFMNGMTIDIDETDPNSGETKSVKVTIPLLYLRMFGSGELSDDEILEKAKELSLYAHPFDVMRRFMLVGDGSTPRKISDAWVDPNLTVLQGTSDVDFEFMDDAGNPVTISPEQYNKIVARRKLLDLFKSNIQTLIQNTNGYVDQELTDAIMRIKRELLSISDKSLGLSDEYGNDLIQDLRNSGDDFDFQIAELLYNMFSNNEVSADNLDDKIQSIIDLIDTKVLDPTVIPIAKSNYNATKIEILDKVRRFKEANADLLNLNLEINTLLLNTVPNPIFTLLNDIIITTTGKERNVVLLINEAEQRFKLKAEAKDITKFLLDGELSYEDFENAILLIELLQSLIRAALTDHLIRDNIMDFNRLMNLISGTQELGEIDTTAAAAYYNDLEQLRSKILFIMQLHNYNSRQALAEQSKLGSKIDLISFDIIGKLDSDFYTTNNGTTTEPKKIGGEEILNDAIKDAIRDAETLRTYSLNKEVNIPVEDQIKIAKERLAIENAVYDRVLELIGTYGQKEVYKVLFSKYIENNSDIGVKTTAVTLSMDNSEVDMMGELTYLMSILGYKSGDFNYYYKQWIDTNTSSIIPLPAQKADIQFGWAIAHNKSMLAIVEELLDTKQFSRMPVLNTIFLQGVPGAGKTSAVDMILYQMLKTENPDIKTLTVAPILQLADKLARDMNVNVANNQALDKKNLFDLIGIDESKINEKEAWDWLVNDNGTTKTITRSLKQSIRDNFKDPNGIQYIFIDEATFFTASELYAIGEYCRENDILLITSGDLNQGGSLKIFEDVEGLSPIDTIDIVMIPSPWELTCSMRPSNTAKRDNNNISTIIAQTYSWSFTSGRHPQSKPNISIQEVIDHIKNNVLNNKKFTGSIDDTGVKGDIVVQRPETTGPAGSTQLTDAGKLNLIGMLKLLISNLEDGETIAYVYDLSDTSIKEFILNSGSLSQEELLHLDLINSIDFFLSKDIQGSERKYCIIDINWQELFYDKFNDITAPIDTEDLRTFIGFTRTLNTVISRSVNGSIIFDNGLSYILGKDAFLTISSDQIKDIKPSPEMLQNYGDTQKAILDSTMQGYTPSVTPPVTSSGGGPVIKTEADYMLEVGAIDPISDLESLKIEVQNSTLEDDAKLRIILAIDDKIARRHAGTNSPVKSAQFYIDSINNTDEESEVLDILQAAIADGYNSSSTDPDILANFDKIKQEADARIQSIKVSKLNAEILNIINEINSCTTPEQLNQIITNKILGKSYLENDSNIQRILLQKTDEILNGIKLLDEIKKSIDTINGFDDYDTAERYYLSLDSFIQDNLLVKEALENKKLLPPLANNFTAWKNEPVKSMTLLELLDNQELLDKIEDTFNPRSGYTVTVVWYGNESNYNQFKNRKYTDDRYTTSSIQSMRELIGTIDKFRTQGPFSILFIPNSGAAGGKRSDFEKIHITSKQEMHNPQQLYKYGDWFEVDENGTPSYYWISGKGTERDTGLVFYEISRAVDPNDPSKDQKLPHTEKAYVFNTRGWKKINNPRRKTPLLLAAGGNLSLNNTKARKFTFVTPNEIANLIDKDGDLGMKMYTGLTTLSSIRVEKNSSGNYDIILMGTPLRDYQSPENLNGILAPFIKVNITNGPNTGIQLYDPLTQYIISNEDQLLVKDRKTDQVLGTCETKTISGKIYNEALNVLTGIKSALVNINCTQNQDLLIRTIRVLLIDLYTNEFGRDSARNIVKNIFPQGTNIDYSLKLFNELSIDENIDKPVFGNASSKDDLLPRRVLIAKVGNFEVTVAKVANPKTILKYYHSVNLMRNYLINSGLLLLDSDDDKKLQNSILRLDKLAVLAYRINYLTNRNSYPVNDVSTGNKLKLGNILLAKLVVYIPLQSLTDLSTGRLTGSLIYNTREASDDYENEGIPYSEFIKLPGITYSLPVILTDLIKNSSMSTRGGMPEINSGKPMIVYTLNQQLYREKINGHWYVNTENRGEKITNDNIYDTWEDAYTRLLQDGCSEEAKKEFYKQLNDEIKYIVASPNSTNFSTYVNTTISLVNNLIKNNKAGRVLLGNQTTGTRLIHTLFNMLADLLEALNNGTLSETFYIGDNPDKEANGKIVLTKENAENISESMNKLLYTLVNRILSNGKASLTSIENKDKLVGRECWTYPISNLDPYGLKREKADRSPEAIKSLREGIITLIKEKCPGINIEQLSTDELLSIPYSINTGGDQNSIDIIGDFSSNNTWKAVPFAIALFFGAISFTGDNKVLEIKTLDDIENGTVPTIMSEETKRSNRLLLDFLDANLTLYGKNPEALQTLSSRNPLNLGFFYTSAYEPINKEGRDTTELKIAYPADASTRQNYRFTAVALSPSIHFSAELTDHIYNEIENTIRSIRPEQIEPVGVRPYLYAGSNWWIGLLNEAMKEFLENININPEDMPSQPIMGSAVQPLTDELKKQLLIQESNSLISVYSRELNGDALLAMLNLTIELIVNSSDSQLSPDEVIQLAIKTINTSLVNNLHNPQNAVVFSINADSKYSVMTLGSVLLTIHGVTLLEDPQYLLRSNYGIVNNDMYYIETIVTKDGSLYRCRVNVLDKYLVNYKPLDVLPEQLNNPPVPPVDVIQLTPENINQISSLLKTLENILNEEYDGYEKAGSILEIDPKKLLMDILIFLDRNQGEDSYNLFIELFNNLDDSLKNQEKCHEEIGASIVRLRNLLPK